MTNDLAYDIYLVIVLFGTPIAIVVVIIHDIRLVNRLTGRVWYPVRCGSSEWSFCSAAASRFSSARS